MCGSGKEENRMLQLLSGSQRTVDALGFLLAFALTALMDSVFREKLPHDHGRAFAVNGELSKGKARGSGLIFVLCIALVTLAVVPLRTEYIIYTVLLIASMLSGYFDDASEVAWNEYKKGLIDLVIAIVAGVTYLNFNSTTVNFLQWSFAIPYPLYLVLIVVLREGQRFDQDIEDLAVAVHHVDEALLELIALGNGVQKALAVVFKALLVERQAVDHHRQRHADAAGKACHRAAAGGGSARADFVDELGYFHICDLHSALPGLKLKIHQEQAEARSTCS